MGDSYSSETEWNLYLEFFFFDDRDQIVTDEYV
jgi:hypothetical protein